MLHVIEKHAAIYGSREEFWGSPFRIVAERTADAV